MRTQRRHLAPFVATLLVAVPAQAERANLALRLDVGAGGCSGCDGDVGAGPGLGGALLLNLQQLSVGVSYEHQRFSDDATDEMTSGAWALELQGGFPLGRGGARAFLSFAPGFLRWRAHATFAGILGIDAAARGWFLRGGGGVAFDLVPRVRAGVLARYQHDFWSEDEDDVLAIYDQFHQWFVGPFVAIELL